MATRDDARGMSRNLVAAALLIAVAVLSFFWKLGRDDARPEAQTANGVGAPDAEGLPRPRMPERTHRRALRWGSGGRQAVHLGSARAVAVAPDSLGFFAGQVRSSTTGAAIPRAELSFAAGDALHSVTADRDGRFRFEPPARGLYELAAVTAKGFLPFAPEWGHSPVLFAATPGRAIEGAALYLNPAEPYFGRVLDPEGKPVAGAMVIRLGTSTAAQQLARLPQHYRSGDQGWFRFYAPDYAVFEARRKPLSPGRASVDFAVQVSRVMTIRLAPASPEHGARAAVSGTVIGPDGEPVPDALVVARFDPERPADPDARLNAGGRAMADEQGAFQVYGLDPGRYTIIASSSGLAAATEHGVVAPAEGVTLQLRRGGTLAGTVRRAADGDPVVSFTVVVTRVTGPLTREVVVAESTFDPQGWYELPPLPAGEYGVTVRARGFAEPNRRTVRVVEDESARADFLLAEGGRIVGRVLDAASRAPLERARISLEGSVGDGAGALPVRFGTSTDAEGRFQLDGVSPGERTVLAAAADHHGKIVGRLAVQAGQDTGPITIELAPTEEDEVPRIELAGIGAVLSAEGDALVIGRIMDGGGAADAGLSPGDAIIAVNGVAVVDLGFARSIDQIRGPEGSTVMLTLRRSGEGDDETVETVVVIRKKIRA